MSIAKPPKQQDGLEAPEAGPEKRFWDSATRYKLLLDLNNAVISQTTREGLFRALAGEIQRIVNFDRCAICIFDSQTKSLNLFAMAEGVGVSNIDDGPRPLDKAQVARTVISTRQPVIIPDMTRYPHWESVRLMVNAGLRATMGFPLIARGNIVGSLHFSFKKTPADLSELAGFLADISGQVALAVDNMLSHTTLVDLNLNLEQQKRYLMRQVAPQYDPNNFIHSSPAMAEIMRQVEVVADSDASVLITGETGTGKDHIAHFIHALSPRRDALFVKVNCPALVPSLFESELFGHAKGAFTGASANRIGRFEMAAGGTVFLDEVGELPMPLQAKLLHVLQDGRFERVGDSRPLEVNFRVIAATNVDLQKALRQNTFRSDLYYRLNIVSFHIPPLRERVEEIEPLTRRLTELQANALHRPAPQFSAQAMAALKNHSWPGNVRELKNIVNRLLITHSGKTASLRDIEPLLGTPQACAPRIHPTLAEAERAHLVKTLRLTKGLVGGPAGAAALLRVPKSTLQYRLRKHALDPSDFS